MSKKLNNVISFNEYYNKEHINEYRYNPVGNIDYDRGSPKSEYQYDIFYNIKTEVDELIDKLTPNEFDKLEQVYKILKNS